MSTKHKRTKRATKKRYSRTGYRKPDARRVSVMIRLSDAERELLRVGAKQRGVAVSELIRSRVFDTFDTRKGGVCPTCGAGWLALPSTSETDQVPF